MYLRRSATEAQLGLAFEFASQIEFLIELELQFELEIQFEFEFEFRFEFEFEFEFDIDFEFRFEFKFEFEFELQFEFTFALAFEKPNFSLRENNSGPLSGAGNSTSVGILSTPPNYPRSTAVVQFRASSHHLVQLLHELLPHTP